MGIRRMSTIPEKARPILLSVMDFSVDDTYFLWQSIVDDALDKSIPYLLDDYRFYNAKQFKPHIYFDTWQQILDLLPSEVIIRCSAMSPDGENVRNATHYTQITGDTDVSCFNDSIWFSPSCRGNTTKCVPLLVQYNLENAMQLAWWHSLPLAVLMVDSGPSGDYADYHRAIRRGRFLFSHMAPIDNLLDAQGRPPALLSLPRTNLQEHVDGIFRTGIADLKPRNYAWRGLAAADPRVAHFAAAAVFADNDIRDMVARSGALQAAGADPLDAAMSAACEWVRVSPGRWRGWIPADCPPGSLASESLTACSPCPSGSYCGGGLEPARPCPSGSFCPGGAAAPTACPAGTTTVQEGSAAAGNCSLCVGLSDLFSSGEPHDSEPLMTDPAGQHAPGTAPGRPSGARFASRAKLALFFVPAFC